MKSTFGKEVLCSICNAPMFFIKMWSQTTKISFNKYRVEKWGCSICDRTENFHHNRKREQGHITEGKNMIIKMYEEQELNNN